MRPPTSPVLLLTNDDGLEEPGLAALFRACQGRGRCLVVAPSEARSNCGHAVTTNRPLHCAHRRPGWTAVDGTPADCVRLGLDHLAAEADWVLSGINAGGNLGADTMHSGTVAAVREAAMHGRSGIAFSHYHARGLEFDWERATVWAARVLEILLSRPPGSGAFWNVNFPHPAPGGPEPAIVFCPVDTSPLPLSFVVEGNDALYNGNYHERARQPGADIETCFAGNISVSLVSVWPNSLASASGPLASQPGRSDNR
jgi:5'-nucleotidase